MKTLFTGSVEETVRKVLGLTYDCFGFKKDENFISCIVAYLDNSEDSIIQDRYSKDNSSNAASKIREMLWGRYSGDGVSAGATCRLFYGS